jgi:hypothetical protein
MTPTPQRLGEATRDSLKSIGSLFEDSLSDSRIVVTETQAVIQGREAVGLASLLHFVRLRDIKLMVLVPHIRMSIRNEGCPPSIARSS